MDTKLKVYLGKIPSNLSVGYDIENREGGMKYMTNSEKLQQWVDKEKRENGLVDIKLYPGNKSQASVESFCASILGFISSREQNRRTKITKL